MTDNRKSTRHNVSIEATLDIDGQLQPTSIVNLSVGGALAVWVERLAPETRVTLQFRIPTHEQPLAVGCTVRWSREELVGLQFDGLRAKEVWALNKYFDTLD